MIYTLKNCSFYDIIQTPDKYQISVLISPTQYERITNSTSDKNINNYILTFNSMIKNFHSTLQKGDIIDVKLYDKSEYEGGLIV